MTSSTCKQDFYRKWDILMVNACRFLQIILLLRKRGWHLTIKGATVTANKTWTEVRFATGENVSEINSSFLCVSVRNQTGLVTIIVTSGLIYPMQFFWLGWSGTMDQV